MKAHVFGCSTCPFVYRAGPSSGCLAAWGLREEAMTAQAVHRAVVPTGGPVVVTEDTFALREDVPTDCPLHSSDIVVTLTVPPAADEPQGSA